MPRCCVAPAPPQRQLGPLLGISTVVFGTGTTANPNGSHPAQPARKDPNSVVFREGAFSQGLRPKTPARAEPAKQEIRAARRTAQEKSLERFSGLPERPALPNTMPPRSQHSLRSLGLLVSSAARGTSVTIVRFQASPPKNTFSALRQSQAPSRCARCSRRGPTC